MSDQNSSNSQLTINPDRSVTFPDLSGLLGDKKIQITDAQGRTFELPESYGLTDLNNGYGGKRLGVIKLGQPSDEQYANLFFYQEKETTINEQTGAASRNAVNKVLGTKEITVYPLGLTRAHLVRTMMPARYIAGSNQGPLCHSENGIDPDARFYGTIDGKNIKCAIIDQTGLKVICPFAQWGEKDPATGKATPPRCGEQYPVFVALSYTDPETNESELLVAEVYFKSTSANAGRQLVRELAAMQRKNIPLYTMPIILRAIKAGPGLSYIPVYTPNKYLPIESAEDIEALEVATRRATDAANYRLHRATIPADTSNAINTTAPQSTTLASSISQGARPKPNVIVENSDDPLV